MPSTSNFGKAWRDHVFKSLQRYWTEEGAKVRDLPVPASPLPEEEELPPRIRAIHLPEWASSIGIDGAIPVPSWSIKDGSITWQKVDWIAVAFWYMENLAERAYELKFGPIHSYSLRLKGWDPQLWEHAWVNRIALFLRKWSAYYHQKDEEILHGPLPRYEIQLTHDVDAVSKTLAIRGKQAAFHTFNAVRAITKNRPRQAMSHCGKVVKFLLRNSDYWCFETIRTMEKEFGQTSIFNFFAGKTESPRSLREWLIDPSYDVHDNRLRGLIAQIKEEGCTIGLHPTYDAWEDQERFQTEKENLEKVVGEKVDTCRQHWLRFSYQSTWKTQESCGILEDSTLGFNDRPGFRNGGALKWCPWDFSQNKPMTIKAFPMILMDSHLYDYSPKGTKERRREVEYWINETKQVRGQASIIWHQRVFSKDYGWGEGFRYLMGLI